MPVEQATRNKFANFTDKDKNLRGYTPTEVQALKDVSQGTAVGNIAKRTGRLAPTTWGGLPGRVAAVGVPVGLATGSPLLGGVAAGGVIGLGYVGQVVSKLSTANRRT